MKLVRDEAKLPFVSSLLDKSSNLLGGFQRQVLEAHAKNYFPKNNLQVENYVKSLNTDKKGYESGKKDPIMESELPWKNAYFYHEGPHVWAWIYTMKLGISQAVYQEIVDYKKEDISRFIRSLASALHPPMSSKDFASIDELTEPNSSNSFKEFSHLLWCVNSKFLRILNPTDEEYYQEQSSMLEWVLDLVSGSSSQTKDNYVQSLIIKALSARYTYPTHSIIQPWNEILVESVCPNQIFMAEAVVKVMQSYYEPKINLPNSNLQAHKKKIMTKWEVLFPHHFIFNIALAKIQLWDSGTTAHKKSFKVLQKRIQDIKFFPWHNIQEPHTGLNTMKKIRTNGPFSLEKHMNIDQYVKEIPKKDHLHNQENEVGNIPNEFDIQIENVLDSVPEATWGVISVLTRNYNKFMKSSSVRGTSINSHTIQWMASQHETPQNGLNSYPRLMEITVFVQEVRAILNIILKLNFRLMLSLGLHPEDDLFLDEQSRVHNEFHSLLTCSDNPQTNSFYNNISSKSKSMIKHPTQQRILEALNFDPRGNEDQKLKMMTRAAVQVIIAYYFKSNTGKFLQVFPNESIFISSLVRITKRTGERFLHEYFMLNGFKEMANLKLFPWRNYFLKTSNNLIILKRLIQSQRGC
ncbi:hypothetical protein PGT21_015450 [Puccinia graminis f. sp. tritici]|nr:hypothetical protein PGT21_015450 [Puccinia graminis f. sp. tritici]